MGGPQTANSQVKNNRQPGGQSQKQKLIMILYVLATTAIDDCQVQRDSADKKENGTTTHLYCIAFPVKCLPGPLLG